MTTNIRQVLLKSRYSKLDNLARCALLTSFVGVPASVVSAQAPSSQPSAPGTHYTQSDFTIPFQVKPGGRCPAHLDLLVSRDAGRSWHIHQTTAPAEAQFRFAKADEGMYWLKVQARDASGISLSQSTMHLIVDRTRPEVTMNCEWSSESTLVVTCDLQDANLNAQKVQLQLRTDVSPVAAPVDMQLTASSPSQATGKSTIDMPACKSFELRLSVTDRAGNVRTLSERYFHPHLATENDALLPATGTLELESPAMTPEPEKSEPTWTAIELGSPHPMPKAQLISNQGRSVVRKTATRNLEPQELTPPPKADAPESISSANPSASPATIQSTTRQFKIHYELDRSIPSENLQVELWVTSNAGQDWEFWGVDRDRTSPAAVEVDHDGSFGFCVVCLHSQADAQYRPTPGTPPDLIVNVKEPPKAIRLQPAARD